MRKCSNLDFLELPCQILAKQGQVKEMESGPVWIGSEMFHFGQFGGKRNKDSFKNNQNRAISEND